MRIFFYLLFLSNMLPTVSYSQATLKIVGYYPFTGNAKDESRFSNHAVVRGATLTRDRFGNQNSAYYDGFDDFISVNVSDKLNQFPVTLSAWVKLDKRTIQETKSVNTNIDGPYTNNIISNDNPYRYGHGFGINVWDTKALVTV